MVGPEGRGRGIYIAGDISPVIEGLRITGGDAAGVGGHDSSHDDWGVGGGVYTVSAAATTGDCQVFSNTVSHLPFGGQGDGLHLHMTTPS